MVSIAIPKVICKIYPNGEFTIGYDAQRRLKQIGHKCDTVDNLFWPLLEGEVKKAVMSEVSNRVLTLGSSTLPNSPKKRRGLNGIGRRASRSVRNMAFLLQKENSRQNLGFITLTLPELTEEDMLSVAENWHVVVKEYFKILGRKYEKKTDKRFEYVGVTEIQEQRFSRSGFVGLHLHFVYVARHARKDRWLLTKSEIRDSWKKCVEKHCKKEYDFSASENCQSVRKDAEGYLGKYLSKGVKAVSKIVASGYTACLPRTWYSRSLSLARRVRRLTRRCPRVAAFLTKSFRRRATLNTVSFYREIVIETPSYPELVVGYVGKFRRSVDILNCKDIMELLTVLENQNETLIT